jgi:hypothetical protein
MADITYKDSGHDGSAYTIVEYHGVVAVYVFKGYLKGDSFVLYPYKSLRKGERRDKTVISIKQVKRG